jgi:imidazolonepropionase-like amidohydrolase/ABC-type multidrug transport system permease subunit
VNTYLALMRMNLRLSLRDRGVLFFNYLFPLIFFFTFAQLTRADQSAMIVQVVNMVLTIGVLGSGLWGQGMRSVQDRELNILRRYKVAPITAMPILVSSILVGLIHFAPVLLLVLGIAHYGYGMAFPERMFSLILFVAVGLLAFRGVGLIIASVVNSAQESQILIQILYMPMLFLSGATIPVVMMPNWVQVLSQFLPATHLFTGMQSILLARENLAKNLIPTLALLTTAIVGTFIGSKLFRWEKEEKLKASAKLWVLAVLLPFAGLGVYQAYSKESVSKIKTLDRTLDRSWSFLIKDARVFVGDGTVLHSASVLIRNGRIAEIYQGNAPEAKTLRAAEIQAAGKTVMPGLIDARVDLGQRGGTFEKESDYKSQEFVDRALAAYLYSGVTAVQASGGDGGALRAAAAKLASGERLGSELFIGNAGAAPVRSLAAVEAAAAWRAGRADVLDHTLVQQVGPPSLLKGTRAALKPRPETPEVNLEAAKAALKKSYESGARLVAGTGSGAPLLIHGPALHRELKLWVEAGVPARAALEAATANAATLLGAADRIGFIRKGYEATILLVDGNPVEDIGATERISALVFKGERIRRGDLLEQK